MRSFAWMFTFMVFWEATSASAAEELPGGAGPITLAQAVAHALERSPMLAAKAHQADADTARLDGREGVPNPSLFVEMEDFLGTGIARGVDSVQVTAMVSQEIPMGGKPAAIRRVNEATQATSSLERKVAEQTLIADVATAFLEVLTHQSRLINAEEMVGLAEATVEAISLQVDVGRATAIEVDKAAIILSLARLDKGSIERDLVVAKQRLASILGEHAPFFSGATGKLDRIEPLPERAAILARVDTHPSLLLQSVAVRRQEAKATLARAARAPDLTLSFGYRWVNATEDSALVAGVALPIPLIDRKKGAIGAASLETLKARKETRQARIALFQSLTEAFEHLAAMHQRARILKNKVYPKAFSTFDIIREGYRLGRFGYLDLLDAQRTLFDIKEQTLAALAAYQRAAIELNRIAAIPLSATRFEPRTRNKGE